MSFDLTNKNISDTFQNLLQKTGSDGKLYDLVGNKIDNLTIDGTLTANTYVVTSSVTNISIATLSGSTNFGDSPDDIHQFTGSLNISGSTTPLINLQASSTNEFIYGWSQYGKPCVEISQGNTAGGGFMKLYNTASSAQTARTHSFFVDPAANSNVGGWLSSRRGDGSETYFGIGNQHWSGKPPTKTLTVAGDISASGKYYAGRTKDLINFSPTLEVEGNISASGHLFLQNSRYMYTRNTSNNTVFLIGLTSGDELDVGNINYETKIHGDGAVLTLSESRFGMGNGEPTKTLTVKGDISASGDIYLESGKAVINGPASDYIAFANQGDGGYTGLFVSQSSVYIGNNGNFERENIPKKLTVRGSISASGDLYVSSGSGVILTSEDGTQYKLVVANGGALSTVEA